MGFAAFGNFAVGDSPGVVLGNGVEIPQTVRAFGWRKNLAAVLERPTILNEREPQLVHA